MNVDREAGDAFGRRAMITGEPVDGVGGSQLVRRSAAGCDGAGIVTEPGRSNRPLWVFHIRGIIHRVIAALSAASAIRP
jgi:hypothetical protein